MQYPTQLLCVKLIQKHLALEIAPGTMLAFFCTDGKRNAMILDSSQKCLQRLICKHASNYALKVHFALILVTECHFYLMVIAGYYNNHVLSS